VNDARPELIRFRCRCGVLLTARASLAGRKGKCQKCGFVNIIPEAEQSLQATASDAVAVQEICSICQTAIEDDDPRIVCDRCELPFHHECWQENLGCSAYGCANVNALKQGPDIRIENTSPAFRPPMRPSPRHAAPLRNRRREETGVPWEFIIMGVGGLAALLSVILFGVPSLIMGVAAVAHAYSRGGRLHGGVIATSVAVSLVGTFLGFLLSLAYWVH
jgi:hypothetical protein